MIHILSRQTNYGLCVLIKAKYNFSYRWTKHNYSHINCKEGWISFCFNFYCTWYLLKLQKMWWQDHKSSCALYSRYLGCKNTSSIWLNLYAIVQNDNYSNFAIFRHNTTAKGLPYNLLYFHVYIHFMCFCTYHHDKTIYFTLLFCQLSRWQLSKRKSR